MPVAMYFSCLYYSNRPYLRVENFSDCFIVGEGGTPPTNLLL